MAETSGTVEEMLARRDEHVKAIAEIDASLKKIQDRIREALAGPEAPAKRGKKGRSTGRRRRAKGGEPPTVAQADKDKFMAALKDLVQSSGKKGQRLSDVARKAGLKGKQAKLVRTALVGERSIPDSGAWLTLP
jgi:hypothetical protein